MRYDVTAGPFPLLRITLDAGETLEAELQAFVAMDGEAEISSTLIKPTKSTLRTMIGGKKSAITTRFSAAAPTTVTLTSGIPGEFAVLTIDAQQERRVLPGAYVAHDGEVALDLEVLKLNATTWIPLLSFTGRGNVFLGASGAVHERRLAADETIVLDRVHLLACDPTLTFEDASERGLWPTLTGQDLLAATGPGQVLYQSLPRTMRSTPLSEALHTALSLR
ncbi:MAG: AIM24 family protein [Myxococcota bacterium]